MLIHLLLPDIPDLQLDEIQLTDQMIILTVRATHPTALCPVCGQSSIHIHSRYTRTVADLPWADQMVQLQLLVRRFFCTNPACLRQTFVERLGAAIRPSARRTERQAQQLQQLAFALGGSAGAPRVAALGMPARASTLIRHQRRTALPPPSAPQIIGVDDWSFRKGRIYGALVVDLERHQPIEVLPDKTAATFATWLKAHPTITIISRDRDSAFAEGAREGAPQAVQVADRFHLHQNLGDALQRLLQRYPAALRAAGQAKTEGPHPDLPLPPSISENLAVEYQRPEPVISAAERPTPAREQRFQEVLTLHAQGWSYRGIAEHIHLDRRTVKRYVLARELPKRGAPVLQTTSTVLPYLGHITRRWNEGCQNGTQLWREIQALGYAGSYSSVRRALKHLRPGDGRRTAPAASTEPSARALSPRQAMWLLVRPDDQLNQRDKQARLALCTAQPSIATATELANEFGRLLRSRDGAAFDGWLQDAKASGVGELRQLALSLERDYDAVKAALELPYSNAQLEGQINRLKLIKRSAYGRAKFDLLRLRVLHAA
jgi:transposase